MITIFKADTQFFNLLFDFVLNTFQVITMVIRVSWISNSVDYIYIYQFKSYLALFFTILKLSWAGGV